MGYTHYWRTKSILHLRDWAHFVEKATKILADPEARKLVCAELDNTNEPPMVTSEFVRFNGRGEDGHETFLFCRESSSSSPVRGDALPCFAFCKTATKPYDKVVCAVLLAAGEAFKGDIAVSSDGNWEEWREGRELFQRVLGHEPLQPPEIRSRDRR